jgi:hypothetical protein
VYAIPTSATKSNMDVTEKNTKFPYDFLCKHNSIIIRPTLTQHANHVALQYILYEVWHPCTIYRQTAVCRIFYFCGFVILLCYGLHIQAHKSAANCKYALINSKSNYTHREMADLSNIVSYFCVLNEQNDEQYYVCSESVWEQGAEKNIWAEER